MTAQDIRQAVHQTMPTAIDALKQLVSIPSIAAPGYPSEPVLKAARLTETQLREAGFQQIRQLDIPEGYPAIYGEIPGPPGTPTVLIYAHYDVQPSGPKEKWSSDPFQPTEKNGRLFGRGAADDKSGIAAHIATIRAFEGNPPASIKVIVEGDEEFSNSLAPCISQHPDLFQADAAIICDHGSIAVGQPTLTAALRGSVDLTIEVQTLYDQQHNGVFGGPVPDALITLCKIIATLHDQHGNVHIPGLVPGNWQSTEVSIPEDTFRTAASILPGVDLIGDRPLSNQLWAGYSTNVIGLDVPTIAEASNSLINTARARINLRVPPDHDAKHAQELFHKYIQSVTPWHAKLTIKDSHASNGFIARTNGPIYQAALQALKEAYGQDAQIIGDGASIPLATTLSEQFPQMEIIIWGAEDLAARIHGPDESVDIQELERVTLTQALFLKNLTQGATSTNGRVHRDKA